MDNFRFYTKIISNCFDCKSCTIKSMSDPVSMEYEEGVYCIEANKLIGSNDWYLERYTRIPEWCPFISEDHRRKQLKGIVEHWIQEINKLDKETYERMKSKLSIDLSFSGFSADDVRSVLVDEFGYIEESMDTNGWQCDFWIYMKNKNVKRLENVTVSGTGMYGLLQIGVE